MKKKKRKKRKKRYNKNINKNIIARQVTSSTTENKTAVIHSVEDCIVGEKRNGGWGFGRQTF